MENANKENLDTLNSTQTSAVTKQKTPQLCRRRNTGLPEVEEQEARDHALSYPPQSPCLNVQRPQDETEDSSEDDTVVEGPFPRIEGTNPVEAIAIETTEETTSSDPSATSQEPAQKPYSAFTKNQRWMIVVISSIAGIFRLASTVSGAAPKCVPTDHHCLNHGPLQPHKLYHLCTCDSDYRQSIWQEHRSYQSDSDDVFVSRPPSVYVKELRAWMLK